MPIGFYRDSFGNVCGRLVAPAGGVTLRGDALVRDSGLPDAVVPTAQQLPIDQLPDEVLQYLMPSRYCETDKLTDIAWSLFANTPHGLGAGAGDRRLRAQPRHLRLPACPPHEVGA